jgi:hypothetical protein
LANVRGHRPATNQQCPALNTIVAFFFLPWHCSPAKKIWEFVTGRDRIRLVWFQPAALTATARHQQLISSMAIKKAQSMHATAGCEQKEGEEQQRGASHTGMAAFLSVSGGSSPKAAGRTSTPAVRPQHSSYPVSDRAPIHSDRKADFCWIDLKPIGSQPALLFIPPAGG